jgi:hypothetical protein
MAEVGAVCVTEQPHPFSGLSLMVPADANISCHFYYTFTWSLKKTYSLFYGGTHTLILSGKQDKIGRGLLTLHLCLPSWLSGRGLEVQGVWSWALRTAGHALPAAWALGSI